MSLKSVLGIVTGFLAHHATDLDNAVTAINGVLDALPVNAETRDHIRGAISGLATSADNIRDALENGLRAAADNPPAPVEIRAKDLTNAVNAYLDKHPVTVSAEAITAAVSPDAITAAVAAYFVANPPVPPVSE